MGYKNYDEFIHSERAVLRQISESKGFKIAEEKESQRVTLPKQAFIEMNQSQRKNEELKQENEELKKQITVAKKIVMTTDIPPRPEVKELPENSSRKERKEHEKELQAAKEWDDKYKLLKAAQITANDNEKAVKAIRHQIQINRENETKIKTSSEQLNLEIKKFHSGIAKNNLIIEKEVQRRLAPSNFAQLHQQENERYLQKQRSLFAVALEQAQEKGKEEQQRKQQLFERVKHKTAKKSKGEWER